MKKLLLLLLLFTAINTYAQNHDLHFEHLNVVEGLPESNIMVMHQDKLGYVWIGTQNGLVRYDGYKVKVYKLGLDIKGLPQDFAISDIYEGRNDELWVSSRVNGIFNYNRAADRFEANQTGLKDRAYLDCQIVFDNEGFLWEAPKQLNTQIAPFAYPLIRWNTKTHESEKFPHQVSSIFVAKNGQVWIGATDGLFYFDPSTKKISKAVFPLSIKDKYYILKLYEAPSAPGILWFNLVDNNHNSQGLYRFDTRNGLYKKFKADPHAPGGIASTDIYTIKEDNRHNLWFGTIAGLSLFEPSSGTFKNFIPPNSNSESTDNPITTITVQDDGHLWLTTSNSASYGNGLISFDPQKATFSQYRHDEKKPYSLNVDRTKYTLIDHTGLLWVGMAWGGVDRVNSLRSQFDTYLPGTADNKSYPASGNTSAALASDGFCWLGSNEGLIKWKPKTEEFERKHLPAYLANKYLNVLQTDRDGLVWCNSDKVSLFTYDPKTAAVDTLPYPDKWPHIAISRIFQDHNGLIWIGTNGKGLYSFDKNSKKFKAYPYEAVLQDFRYNGNKLDNGQVRSIYEDEKGVIWVGTNQGGLNRLNKEDGTFKSYDDRAAGFSTVMQIFEDKAGRFWLGTYLGGLFLFDRTTGKTQQFTVDDGLLDNDIHGIQEDKAGNLWIPCERGFTRFDPVKKTFARYTADSGLPFPLKRTLLTSFLKTEDGQFILISTNGVIAFYPSELHISTEPPQVQLETFAHNNPQSADAETTTEELYGKQKVEVPHDQNRISFNYVALHFENPSQNQYAYKLQGYDKNWVQAGAQRSVTYTNLSPGTYTFKVKASNSDGIWNEKGAMIVVVIHPPWWTTWWAWALWILMFVSVVYGFITFRSRKLLHDKKILEHKVHIRTEEVMQQKEEIEAQHDNLEKAFQELKLTQTQLVQSEKMASLGELTAGIAHEIQNPLNFVNNFSEVSIELLEELQQEAKAGHETEVLAIAGDISQNLEKINHHGKRADSIVKSMLEHSRSASRQKELTNVNQMADEYMRLAYHGLRAKDKSFNADLVTQLDHDLPKVNGIGQEIGRVLLNLFNNAFYAVNQKSKTAGPDYKPEVSVSTAFANGQVLITVKDNGVGIPDAIKEKIMQPFFTTKPTGEGTGLGLSLSYDIVVKGHGGKIEIDTKEGEFTEFRVYLPV